VKADDPRAERIRAAAALVKKLAGEKGVPAEAIVLAWLLRHPARIQPIIGTRQPERVRAACQADRVSLTREEWYALYQAGRGRKLP
jgi:predicted oxidoreductase